MANDYFEHDNPVSAHTLARDTQINGIAQAIEAGFDMLPAPDALKQGRFNYFVDSGAANAYVVTFSPVLASYTAGLRFTMKVTNANTGASTINAGPGAIALRRFDGSALQSGDLFAGMLADLQYHDSSNTVRIMGEVNASSQAATATTQAGIATTQAGISTAQAVIATTQAGLASTARTGAETAQAAAEAALAELEILTMDYCSVAQVGNGLSITGGNPAIAAMTSTRIAKTDDANDTLGAYDWDGTDWVLVGSALALTGYSGLAGLAALNSTDVAFIDPDNEDLKTYRFNGSTWTQVGNSLLDIGTIAGASLAALNSTDIAAIGEGIELRTYRFDGTDWAQVGNGLEIAGDVVPAITALNSTDIAFIDSTDEELRTYRFDGTDWAQVGNGLAVGTLSTTAITALNATDVAFINDGNDELRLYRWDGTDWTAIGHPLEITSATTPAIAALNDTDIAFIDANNDSLRTYRWTKKLGSHGWYDGTLTGLTTSPTARILYSIVGDVVTLTTANNVSGTSNATSFTITGAPAIIRPSSSQAGVGFCVATDNGATTQATVRMSSAGTLTLLVNTSAAWTGSGTKGIPNGLPIGYTYKLTNP